MSNSTKNSDKQSSTKRCNICKERKPLSGFYSNSSSKDFLSYKCRSCNAEYAKQHVQCSKCGTRVRRDSLSQHKRSIKCKESDMDKPWQQFKSTGKKRVLCPCKHPMCPSKSPLTMIAESTAYKHLKHKDSYSYKIYGEWRKGKLIRAPRHLSGINKLRFKMCMDFAELKRKYKHNPKRLQLKIERRHTLFQVEMEHELFVILGKKRVHYETLKQQPIHIM